MLKLDGDDSEEDEEIMVEPRAIPADKFATQTPNHTVAVPPPVAPLLFKYEEEEEEEDAPLPSVRPESQSSLSATTTSQPLTKVFITSQEYMDALQVITTDPWDISSWMTYLEEVDSHRAGSVSVDDAYNKALAQFPLSSLIWKAYLASLVHKEDFAAAEVGFQKCLQRCRSPDLWLLYLDMTRAKISSKQNKHQQSTDRQVMEDAFEKAVDNVGYSIHAGELWRSYIDFVHGWSENAHASRKLQSLRKIYQRVLCLSVSGLDTFWREYDQLEKAAGEQLADKVLPEYHEKYLHAKTMYKERQVLSSSIDLQRLAVPPSNSVDETKQLEAWSKWIRFELTNPDNLSPDDLSSLTNLLFDQFICCFRLHPEVWLIRARYEQTASPPRILEARQLLREGINSAPTVASLRFALAELEETLAGGVEAAKDVLRTAFESIPCALTFSVLQRFIRRKEGVAAARKLFSDTAPLRTNQTLGYEINMCHAQLELDVNCCPDIALKILNLARASDPAGTSDVQFIRLLTRVLVRLGDLRQLRWVYQTVLEQTPLLLSSATASSLASSGAMAGEVAVSATATTVVTSGLVVKASTQQDLMRHGTKIQNLKDQLLLWEEYLEAETVLGMSDIKRLDELRANRNRVHGVIRDLERAHRLSVDVDQASSTSFSSPEQLRFDDMFFSSRQLYERYQVLVRIPPDDESMLARSSTRSTDRTREDSDIGSRSGSFVGGGAVQQSKKGGSGGSSSASGSSGASTIDWSDSQLATLPTILREFIAKLPLHINGPPPAPDLVVRQLKSIVLPPKPTIDESSAEVVSSQVGKRSRKEGEAGDDEEDDEVEFNPSDDYIGTDIFKKRQRERL